MAGVNSIVILWYAAFLLLWQLLGVFTLVLVWRSDGVGVLTGYALGSAFAIIARDFWIGIAVKMPGV